MELDTAIENIELRKDNGFACKACSYVGISKEDLKEHSKQAHAKSTPPGSSSLAASIASLALRGFLGTTMILHGLPKLRSKKEQTLEEMEMLGVPRRVTVSTSLFEVTGGVSLLAGFMVPVVCSLFVAEMAGTTVLGREKMGKQFLSGGEKPAYELDVMYAVAFSTLAAIGGGDFSVDRLLRDKLKFPENMKITSPPV
jgi:uncharacterized membrane protein YphA (DoxX/SURF4 family)